MCSDRDGNIRPDIDLGPRRFPWEYTHSAQPPDVGRSDLGPTRTELDSVVGNMNALEVAHKLLRDNVSTDVDALQHRVSELEAHLVYENSDLRRRVEQLERQAHPVDLDQQMADIHREECRRLYDALGAEMRSALRKLLALRSEDV